MRDLAQRVRNATSTGVLDTSRAEMGKLANTLRGFVAYENPVGLSQGSENVRRDDRDRPQISLARMMNVDYKVSGIPGQCGRGSAPVFFNIDPYGPDGEYARIVDPYIRGPDGSMVENPLARVGPICMRRMGESDLMSGYPTGGPGPSSNMATSHLMGAHRRRRVSKKRATKRGRK
eukprot:jgi/Mesvir1/16/Mv19994-RA.1